ncbi:MAG: hypothetical protein JWO36_4821 [Myxococcales bacterium]|nr:hypothetical protein [Myxococcales bacterium]
MRIWIVASVIAGGAGLAEAGKVKAELLCGVMADGKISDVVPNKKKPRLDQPVACALHLSVENNDTFMGNIHTVRYAVDASTGKKTKITTQGETSDIENHPGLKKDIEIVMKPAAPDERGDVLFQACEDFDVVGSVFDDRGTYFTKSIHIEQACPKPKPLKASITCIATKDGDRIDLPDKKKRSLDGYAVACFAQSSDPRLPKAKFWGRTEYDHPTMDDSNGHTKNDARTGKYEEGEDESAAMLTLEADDIPVCLATFDINLFIDDASGAHLFTKKVTVKQKC